MAGHLISWPRYPNAIPCHALPWHPLQHPDRPAFVPGLISCHSRCSRDQEHSVVCSLTAQVPASRNSPIDHNGEWGVLCLCLTETLTVKKMTRGDDDEGYIRMYSSILLRGRQRKALFIANAGRHRDSVGVWMSVCWCWEKFYYISIQWNFYQSILWTETAFTLDTHQNEIHKRTKQWNRVDFIF